MGDWLSILQYYKSFYKSASHFVILSGNLGRKKKIVKASFDGLFFKRVFFEAAGGWRGSR